jgi:hypothetical protein
LFARSAIGISSSVAANYGPMCGLQSFFGPGAGEDGPSRRQRTPPPPDSAICIVLVEVEPYRWAQLAGSSRHLA